MYVLCDMSLCLTVTPPESGSESWCYSYNLHPSVSFNKICKNRKDDAMQVHFRLLLIFFLTLVSKLPPYSSRLNPAQGPVAWCLQWPGTRHSLNFPRSSDSWWCQGRAEPGAISQSGSGPGSGYYKCLEPLATKWLLQDDVICELVRSLLIVKCPHIISLTVITWLFFPRT